jgi:hypothetical protein
MKGEDMNTNDPRVAAADEYLSKLEAKLPAALREEALSMSREDLYRIVADKAIEHLMTMFHLFAQARSRCSVCPDEQTPCGHCTAEEIRVQTLLQGAISLALMVKVATGPGSRVAAQLEHEHETEPKA